MRLLPLILAFTAGTIALGPALADDINLPARKPGQWEMTVTPVAGKPVVKIGMCLDASTDKAMMASGLSVYKDMCSQEKMTRSGSDFVIDATCPLGKQTMVAHTVISGDFQSAYTITTNMKISAGAGLPTQDKTSVEDARWVSATCADGLQPGDMLMPGGKTVNVGEMMKQMGTN